MSGARRGRGSRGPPHHLACRDSASASSRVFRVPPVGGETEVTPVWGQWGTPVTRYGEVGGPPPRAWSPPGALVSQHGMPVPAFLGCVGAPTASHGDDALLWGFLGCQELALVAWQH